MINVTSGVGVPCIWIRYNPDDYKVRDSTRKDVLLRCLRRCMSSDMMPKDGSEFCRVVQLFFDEFKLGQKLELVNIKID